LHLLAIKGEDVTDHNPLPMPNNGLSENVEFACGHRTLLLRSQIRELGGSPQLAAIDIGNQFGAVRLDANSCTMCSLKTAVCEIPLDQADLQVN
jgi:hypothetical protein